MGLSFELHHLGPDFSVIVPVQYLVQFRVVVLGSGVSDTTALPEKSFVQPFQLSALIMGVCHE